MVLRCKCEGKWNPDSCPECSIHFTDSNYERDLKNKLLHLPQKKRLKRRAVPSVNLPPCASEKTTIKSQEKAARADKRKQRKLVREIISAVDDDDAILVNLVS